MIAARKWTSLAILALVVLLIAAGCGKRETVDNTVQGGGATSSATATPTPTPEPSQPASTEPNTTEEADATSTVDTSGNNPIVTIEMDSGKTIKIELYPKVAPNTVNNFISLVQKGFYDGTIFHRVIPGFMIQGGDPEGTGMGGPDYSIKGEFTQNGFKNDLKHTKGVISMARTGYPDSAGSQFFIMVEDAPHLDGAYASFGKVIEGQEVADEIVSTPRNAQDRPKTEQKMNKVTVDLNGYEAAEPEIIK